MTFLERLERGIRYAVDTGRAKTQTDVAVKAGLSKGYLGKTKGDLKRNPNYDPGRDTIQKLATAMGVRAEWLGWERGAMLENGEPTLEVSRPEDIAAEDGLDVALSGRWWEPHPLPSPSLAAQITNEAREERNKAAASLSPVYWAEYMRSRLQGLRRPDKVISGAVVHDAGTDNPLDDFGGRRPLPDPDAIGRIPTDIPPPPESAPAKEEKRPARKGQQKTRRARAGES